jgi:hypothetical protein
VAPLDASARRRRAQHERGPIYDPAQDKMLNGVINTYAGFAETTLLLRSGAAGPGFRAQPAPLPAARQSMSGWRRIRC